MMPVELKQFLQRWAINTVAVLVATHVVGGIHYDTAIGLLVATLLLGILNAFVRPLLMALSLPLLVFTLGLFTLVINAALLYFVGSLVKTFHVETFWDALLGALIISLISMVLGTLTGVGGSRIEVRRGRRPPPRGPGDGDGPVIDV
jgi:putative membrane protein